jgi:hypothetical protein
MRKLVLAMAGAAALAISSAAGAQVTLDGCTMVCDGPTTLGSETTIGFTESGLDAPSFIESLMFTNDLAGVYALTLDTSSTGIDFTSAVLTGPGGPYNLIEEFDNGVSEFWNLSSLYLEAGQYTLTINGDNRSTGSLGGTVTINAVPEPGTWAMMLLGFGAAGYAMRRRRAPVLAQAA